MRFSGIRFVKQTEQNYHRIRVCLEEKQKTSESNSRAILVYQSIFQIFKQKSHKVVEHQKGDTLVAYGFAILNFT